MANKSKSKNKNNYLMVAADVIIAAFGIPTLFPAATMTTAYAQKANNNNNIPAGYPEGTTSFEHEMCITPPNLLCDETLSFVMD
jgi:hypothetical protein